MILGCFRIHAQSPPPGRGKWQFKHSSGWIDVTTNPKIMQQIDSSYCAGQPQLDYQYCYRGKCPDWVRWRALPPLVLRRMCANIRARNPGRRCNCC